MSSRTAFDMSPLSREGRLAYEGLVTLSRDDETAELWGRIYLAAEDEHLWAEPQRPEWLLVVTSKRPDLPAEKQAWTTPPFGISRSTLEPDRPLTLRVPATPTSPAQEATVCWNGGLELGGRSREPAFWVADLRVVGPLRQAGGA